MIETSRIICAPTVWHPDNSGKDRKTENQKVEVSGRLGSDDNEGYEKGDDGYEPHE